MPAHRGLSTGAEGRRPKAFREGTRGGWVGSLPSMGICWGDGRRKGHAGRHCRRRIADCGLDFVAASGVDQAILARSPARHERSQAPGQQ